MILFLMLLECAVYNSHMLILDIITTYVNFTTPPYLAMGYTDMQLRQVS